MATTAGHRLTLDPMGKCSNAFFSETTNMIKAKLYMNVHWMVLYKLYVFCSDMKFKMVATLVEICFHSAGHRSSTQEFSAGHSEFLPDLHFLCQIVLMPSNVIPLLLF